MNNLKALKMISVSSNAPPLYYDWLSSLTLSLEKGLLFESGLMKPLAVLYNSIKIFIPRWFIIDVLLKVFIGA